jgi:hypothetical protein
MPHYRVRFWPFLAVFGRFWPVLIVSQFGALLGPIIANDYKACHFSSI